MDRLLLLLKLNPKQMKNKLFGIVYWRWITAKTNLKHLPIEK